MKKALALLSIVILLLSCSNGNMEDEETPDYYPYEVSNLKYTKEKGELVVILMTWENPTDSNFDHVSVGQGTPRFNLASGINSYQIVAPATAEPIYPYTVYCVDKQGKVSKGVRCTFGYPDYE